MLNVSLIERTEEDTRSLFSRTVDNGVIRLDRFVGHNPEGWRWMRKLRGETEAGRRIEDEVITVLDHKWGEEMFYGLLPEDGYAAEGDYGVGGNLRETLGEIRFVDINPEDEVMRGLRIVRRRVSSKRFSRFFTSYYLADSLSRGQSNEGYFPRTSNGHGYLLGDLEQGHFREFTRTLKGAFPLHTFAEVVYPSRDGREFIVRVEYA